MEKFSSDIRLVSQRIQQIQHSISTEEATKTALIMPFFQTLGYDVFNPAEFTPEYIADVGIKKGEKVDYAIMDQGQPTILIEAKSIREPLTKHDSQLFRYYGTTQAKFAILTNGDTYRFYTDLETPNVMDTVPFFEITLSTIKDNEIKELYKFKKQEFNVNTILSTAEELKYLSAIKEQLKTQSQLPSDEFIRLLIQDCYQGIKTQTVVDKFRPIVSKAFTQFMNENMNERIKHVISGDSESSTVSVPSSSELEAENTIDEPTIDIPSQPSIETTQEEIEGYATVKVLLGSTVDKNRIFYRDNASYFNILIDDSNRKWVCRLHLNSLTNKYITFRDEPNVRHKINEVYEIEQYKERLSDIVNEIIAST
ncbi:endonuclease (plasmid) [Exiguobacterium sp. N4-1P]|uniref:type I restriction endonuclease n=1 Tax=Exiguobacterium sp. N4-1P TaxID=2051906 RepID=UPI000B58983F|nr:type I restriction endonuclease [Exiguobacterium sp. N4-1P]ASI35249.1 endonuclease [Exiguobacterium sp. N4-1P]ASI37262.1 endonuclease [Exiguobacterium sp. N4-1P]